MCKAPFEPLDKALLFHLSVKTVFLLTMATARRVSEVHAFSIDSNHLRFRSYGRFLNSKGPRWDFWQRFSSLQGLLILLPYPNYPISAVQMIILTACYVLFRAVKI